MAIPPQYRHVNPTDPWSNASLNATTWNAPKPIYPRSLPYPPEQMTRENELQYAARMVERRKILDSMADDLEYIIARGSMYGNPEWKYERRDYDCAMKMFGNSGPEVLIYLEKRVNEQVKRKQASNKEYDDNRLREIEIPSF